MPRKTGSKPDEPVSEDCPAAPDEAAGDASGEAPAKPVDAGERWVLNGDVVVSRRFDVMPPRRGK